MASGGPQRTDRASARDERGFTIVELLTSASLMLVVAAAVMTLMLVGFRQTDNQNDRVVALDDSRNALLKMQNEIRSASGLDSVSPQVLDVLIHVPEDTANPYHWIRYKCVGNDLGSSGGLGGTCSRQDKTLNSGADCSADASGPGCTLILRHVVKHGEAHFAEPCDNYVSGGTEEKHFCVKQNRTVQLSIFVEVPGAENPIELRGAITVRNCLDNQEQVYPCVESTPST
jgi:type II secretory pathway pseudopilin PulG